MNFNLNNGKERLKKGIYLASSSFALLWKHKILSLYLAVTIGAYILTQLISYNVGCYDLSFATGLHTVGPLFDFSRWHHYLSQLLITFTFVLLYTFVTVALIYQTNQLLGYQVAAITQSIRHANKKGRLILIWSLIITALAYTIQIISNRIMQPKQLYHPIMVLVSILGLAWSLFTLMVLPIITLERTTTIPHALTKSITIVKAIILEIISGEFWIALMAFLAMIPFAIPLFLIQAPKLLLLGATGCILAIIWIISTVQVIFKTMIYNYYMEPIEEMEVLKYPRF